MTVKSFIKWIDKSKIQQVMFLSFPVMIENILQTMMGTIDTYFVSKIGTKAIASVGATNLVVNIFIAFFIALSVGSGAIISRNIGAEKLNKAKLAIKQGTILSIILGIVLGIINLIFGQKILELTGLNKDVLNYGLSYFNVITIPIIFLALMMNLSSSLRNSGDTKTPMKVAIVSNIVNIVLDYILIFGKLGFCEMGILGAGIGTTISRFIGVLLLFMSLKKSNICFKINEIKKIDNDTMKSIILIGFPAGVEKLIMRFGQLVYGGLIIKIGTNAYAAHNIAGTIEAFSYLPGMGFGIGVATLVGQNLGKGLESEAKNYGYLSFILSSIFMVIIALFFYLFAYPLAKLFSSDIDVIELVVRALRIIALFQPFLCSTLVITSALQGGGKTKFPMYSTLIGIWGIMVGGIYLLSIKTDLTLSGVWWMYALEVVVSGTMLLIYFAKTSWNG